MKKSNLVGRQESITSSEFEEKFEAGEDITTFLDVEKATRPGSGTKKS